MAQAAMPEIKVFSNPQDEDSLSPQRSTDHPAAALMYLALARLSDNNWQSQAMPRPGKPEKARPGNPNRLTVKQHVFPARIIKNFTNASGKVGVRDIVRQKTVSTKPTDVRFCALRAWDHRAEAGYMKRIEDQFQQVIQPILRGDISTVADADRPLIDRMYALWYMRACYRTLPAQQIQIHGVLGDDLTLEQEENLEKNGYLFSRKDGKVPARQMNGVTLEMRIGQYSRQLAADITRWGVIKPRAGEFVVPDVPEIKVLPISPTVALLGSHPDGTITEQDLAYLNLTAVVGSREYYFAHNLVNCHLGP